MSTVRVPDIPGAVADEGPGQNDLWEWFGLSRASFLTLPRALMHQMPDAWQGQMAALLREYDRAFPFLEVRGYRSHVSLRVGRRIVAAPEWMTNYRHPDRSEILRNTR